MNSLEFLEQLTIYRMKIDKQAEKVKELQLACLPTSYYAAEKVQTSRKTDSLEEKIIMLHEEKEKLETLVYQRELAKNRVIGVIQELESADDIALLYFRYVKEMKFLDMSKKLNCNRTHLSKKHKEALKRFNDLFSKLNERRCKGDQIEQGQSNKV